MGRKKPSDSPPASILYWKNPRKVRNLVSSPEEIQSAVHCATDPHETLSQ